MLERYQNSYFIIYGNNEFETKKSYEILAEQCYNYVYYSTEDIELWEDTGFKIVVSSDGIDIETAIDQSLKDDKPAFLFFYSNSCRYCQDQKSVLDELSINYGEKIEFINVNNTDNPEVFTSFDVNSYPTMFLVVDKNETEYMYKDFNGFTAENELISVFDMMLNSDNSFVFDGWWHDEKVTSHTPLGLPLAVAKSISHDEDTQVILQYIEDSDFAEEASYLESIGFEVTAEIPSQSVIAGTMSPSVSVSYTHLTLPTN